MTLNELRNMVLYSDASWEIEQNPDGTLWLDAGLGGFCKFSESSCVAFYGYFPERLLPLLNPRQTQIVMAEAVALLWVLKAAEQHIKGSRLLLFVDNIALVCSVCKGTSAHSDIQSIVTSIHLYLFQIGCAWWIEYVPSKLNLADSPSRAGPDCKYCLERDIPILLLEDDRWRPDEAIQSLLSIFR